MSAPLPLFQHPGAPHALWLLILVVCLPAIALALLGLARGRLPGPARAVLFLLPFFAYVLGDLMVMEESKNVRFCGSCHEVMTPLAQALGRDTGALSSIHYRMGAVSYDDACYQCHSGYGIWGTVGAKLAGVKHMWRTLTHDYRFPLEHEGAFDIDSCLACHAEAVPFRAVEAHRDPDLQQALLSREMGCTGACHPSAHPEQALNGLESWLAYTVSSSGGPKASAAEGALQ